MWPRFFGALVAGRQGHKNDCKKYWLQYISENTWFQRKYIEFHLFKREKNQCKIYKNNCTFFQILGHSEGADFLLRQRTHSPAIGTFLPVPVMPGMSTRFKWAKHDIAKKGGRLAYFAAGKNLPIDILVVVVI